MAKKKLGPNDYWAYQVYRTELDRKEYIFAVVRRRYDGGDDIETTGVSEYWGVERINKYPKITDNDPDSDTFGERIDKPNADPTGSKLKLKYLYNDKNKKMFQDMCGPTAFGDTQFYFKFKQKVVAIPSPLIFWKESWNEAASKYIYGKQTIVIENETNNNNTPRRRTGKTKPVHE